jgi:hypothetical protein
MSNYLEAIEEIDPTSISFANKFLPNGFRNPRHFLIGGGIGKGLEPESMEQLKSDIIERGIRTPIDCRRIHVDGKDILQLTAALQLNLPIIPARIHDNMSDEDAWKFAWRDDDIPKSIGENATASLVKFWRQQKYDDAKILDITGRTKAWLRQMDVLGELDPECFSAYSDGNISLRNAIRLAQIPDLELRVEILRTAIQDAEADYARQLQNAKASLNRAEDRVEIAQANVALAQSMGDDVDEANEELKVAENAKRSAENKYLEQKGQKPQARAGNLAAGAKKVGAKQIATSLSKAKLKKLLHTIDEWIENDGRDEEDDFIGEIQHLQLVRSIINSVLIGEVDIKSIFSQYYEETKNENSEDEVDEDEEWVGDEDDDEEWVDEENNEENDEEWADDDINEEDEEDEEEIDE